jgi:hypothetical protein
MLATNISLTHAVAGGNADGMTNCRPHPRTADVILQDVILQDEAIFPALRREQKLTCANRRAAE